MFKRKGRGVKGVLNNVKKNARLVKRGIPYLEYNNYKLAPGSVRHRPFYPKIFVHVFALQTPSSSSRLLLILKSVGCSGS